ncbi:MAG: hypothetical protein ACK5JI_10300 [Azonexus sp.]
MLAPLENRAILERAPAGETDDAAENDAIHLQAENHALRAALERVRRRQKRLVFLGGRRSLQQAQRITLLEQRCAHYQNRLSELESGQAIIELAQQVIALKEFIRTLGQSCQHALAEPR